MIELFQMGGILFMSLLSLIFFLVLILTVRYLMKSKKKSDDLDLIKSTGLFAAIFGVLGQLIGLYSAFQAIENIGSMSPVMLVGGLKISSITTIYGLLIYLVALFVAAILKLRSSNLK